MRSLPGSPALRALVYVDEIFGFFPPSAEPPTKKPLLTLLKQARAFGVGVVLASQNPVDLDYRGLANCGCWWVGTLQTERDKMRLSEGLVEAGGKDASALLDQDAKARLPPERRAPQGARARRDALGDELSPRADDEGRPREAEGRRRRDGAAAAKRTPAELGGARPSLGMAGAMAREAECRHRVPGALREVRRALPLGHVVRAGNHRGEALPPDGGISRGGAGGRSPRPRALRPGFAEEPPRPPGRCATRTCPAGSARER